MSELKIIDFNKPLPFSPGGWFVTSFWGDATLKGLRSNAIGHGQSTAFSFRERFRSIKITYEVSSETSRDKLRIDVDGVTKLNQGTSSGVFEHAFATDGEHSITFTYQKDGSVSSGQDAAFLKEIAYQLQYEIRYLIQDSDGVLYTLLDAELLPLTTQEVCAQNFLTHGLVEAPSGDWIKQLPNAKVLYFQDTLSEKVPKLTAYLNATPPNQIILSQALDMDHPTILGIKRMTADCDGFVRISVSFDHNQTWWTFEENHWVSIPTQEDGMNRDQLNLITTEDWASLLNQVAGSLQYRISFVVDETTILRRLDIDYINPEEG